MKRWPRSKITGWILLASFQFANRTGASRVPDWSILGPVLKPETICRLRGGSIKIPDSREQLRRKQGLSIHQSSTDEVAADADSEMHASRDAVNDIVVPIIEAILIPRSITLTTLVRWVTLLAAAVSFIACIRTAGTTYVSAIWATLHPDADVPPGVKVSPLDETIAHYITEASRDMLPPRFLPSPGPLISFVTSLSTWVTFSVLLPRWFTHVCVFMNYHRTRTDGETLGKKIVASHLSRNRTKSGIAVLVEIPREQREFENDGRSHAVRPLLTSPPASDFHPLPFYFDMNHRRIYCDVVNASARCVDGGPSLHSTVPIRELLSQEKLSGLTTISRLSEAQARYGPYASLSIQQPTILLAFCNRLASPLSVFQFLGKLLTALEETLLASFLGLASTLLHHYWNARQSIVSARELAIEVQGSVEGASLRKVWVLRPRTKKRGMRWKELSAVDLLPGDIFILGLTDNETFVPADALLLEGRCIVNESVLTGESVPQAKVPLDVDLDNAEEAASPLDLLGSHRNSILFAGTSLFYCAIAHGSETSGGLHPSLPTRAESKVGDKWIKLLALRTGAYSSRGDLLRALSKSGGHVGAIASPQSEKDAIWLVGSLSAFAVVACASLFEGNHLAPKNPSSFRRVVQCTRIAIASIPSDLPLILSSIAHSCASVLRMEADVACTEPGSLLTAAHVGTVVFDKTGTLTADTQSLSCVLPPAVDEAASPFANAALAGCHSLVHFGGNVEAKHLAGDPLDRASFEYSGWSSNGTEGSFVAPAGTLDERGSIGKTEPKQLWQIKTFAFDATKRTSSALILVLYRNSTLRLWKVMKGSPDTIIPLACADQSARSCVLERVACVEANGVRTIVLAAADMTSDLTLVEALFPNGLPSSQASPSSVGEAVQGARDRCDFLHRDVLESSGEGRGSIEIVGIACFEATIRSSTKRVLTGLKAAGLKTTMLTGDSTNAAVSVAAKAGLLSSEHIEILGVDSNEIVGRASRVDRKWPLGGSPLVQSKKRSISSREVRSIIRRVRMGRCCLVATGDAVEMIMGDTLTENLLRDNLNVIDIVARASPKQKQEFVGSLRRSCKKKVLMCGDGVNDVAAMKMSDVAVAMLNGYGDEQILVQQDTENAQRLERITKKRIGSNRRLRTNKATSTEQLGVGQSVSAAAARVKDEMKKSIDGIHESALGRGQRKEVDEGTPVYTMQDIRGIVLAAWQACRNERIRAKTLRKGGAKAAHILAKEDELRRQSSKTSDSNEPVQSSHLRSAIRPGEASLAASFSCLRPSISGVDTLLRTGVAAAACALSVQQTVALNCLMACYNMATLYRDGFRYGKFMWNIEMILFGSINQASYLTSCTPRPVLAYSRPPESLFHPESLMLVISQAFIHLVTLNGGVKVANELEIRYSSPIKIPLIRLKRLAGIKSQSQNTLTALLEVLVRNVVFRDAKETRTRGLLKLFRRPPFKPNYTTNFVLVMSVFQNAVSAMMTHSGKPFYGTLLESRKLCLSIAASLFFSVACVSETFPVLNELLELRPMRSHHGQTAFLALFLLDFLACYASRWISTGMSKNDLAGRSELFLSNQDAAAIEEKLLEDEARQNRLMLLGLVGAAWMVTLLTTASAS